jgi:tetrahydromethanopterin S-methyltransferase subunit B
MSEPELSGVSHLSAKPLPGDSTHAGSALLGDDIARSGSLSSAGSGAPGLSRTPSFSNSSYQDDSDAEEGSFFPPVERLTMFDFIENLALPQRVERLQTSLQAQAERIKKQQARLKNTGMNTRDRVVEEWRRRVPMGPEEQLEKYRKRMRKSVDRLSSRWNEHTVVTAREKASFIAGVINIFISGYLVGGYPDWFPVWYTVQLLYFMPIRYYTYHKKGYHYFLADLCYFVNLLLVLSIWLFPNSKRLFISSYCLAMGNNAIAIAMWRNSLVFHSMDKVVR